MWSRKLLEPRQPSLVVFTPVAVATTLFMGLIIGFSVAQLSGDPEQALKSSIIAAVSLPIALLAAIFLSLGLPYRWFASSSTPVALLSSYAPYIVGSLSGVWAALWLWNILLFEYGAISTSWQLGIAGVGTGAWFVVGRFTNHLAGVVERRKDYEKGLEELMESRHRIMLIHEQTRKEVAGLLHGRVQSRLVVLGHWLKDCQGQLKEGPAQAMESLEEANKLLREIRDQELRNITRQLYPSIIRTGLPSALNSLADRFRSVFSVEVLIDNDVAEMDNPMNPRLNESLRLTLYRVAEEALGNVAKHAQANEVWLSLSLSPAREMMLVVRDNGRGFDRSTAKVGQGLLSIDDYVMALGGTVQVTSAAGAGTVVVVSVPAFAAATTVAAQPDTSIEPFMGIR